MKKLAFLSACLLTMACSSEQYSSDAPVRGDGVTVRLSASGGSYELTEGGKTRAADGLYTSETGFTGGETVKVYKLVGSDTESAYYSVGAPTAGKSDLTAVGDELHYPAEGTTTLYAVYPSTSTESHVVMHDQKTDAAYKASDLMYAPAINVTKEQRTQVQNLDFQHQLVKLKVVINKTAEVGQVTGVTLKNVKRKTSVTVASTGMTVGEATPVVDGDDGYSATAATNNSILVSGEETAAPGVAETYTYACVFPAQAWAEADFITIAADAKTTTYKLTKTFEAGHFYQLTVTLNGLALGSTVTIDNWTGNESICNVNPAVPGGGTLKFSDINDVIYNGSAFEPAMTVYNAQNEALTPGTDYTLQYFSNTNAGQAIVFATGTGDYDGQIGFTGFNIFKAQGSISYDPASVTMTYGDADFLNTATLSPDAGTGLGTVTYASSDPTVATIDASTGLIHILKAGATTITATVADGMNFEYAEKTATCDLTVNKAAGFVTLSPTSGEVTEGETATFTVATNHGGELSVASSDESKATATIEGTTVTVTGVAVGSATITVTCATTDNYEAATATYTATVKTADSGAGGTLQAAENGDKVGSDGKAYKLADAFPDGVTLVGVVAGKNGTSGYVVRSFDTSNMKWDGACSYSESAGDFHVSDLNTTVSKRWICGSKSDYYNCGVSYSNWNTLNNLLINAGADQLSVIHWTTTPYSNTGTNINFRGFGNSARSNQLPVRPLFAF